MVLEEEEDEVLIPNIKKQQGKNKTYVSVEHFENKSGRQAIT